MTPPLTPQIEPLSPRHRLVVFLLSIFLFVTLVPLLVFYAIGYRFDFKDSLHNIKSVGGLYLTSQADGLALYLDDKPVENIRIFQRAAYIQDVEAGVHRVYTEGRGVTTWVKELPVFAHFVTEAASFNMPQVPQLRPVTPYQTEGGAMIVRASSTLDRILASASSTTPILLATTTATSSYLQNPEYIYLSTLFASSTETRDLIQQVAALEAERFAFAPGRALPTTTATTTVVSRDLKLFKRGAEVYAAWVGDSNKVPYYFCARPASASSTATLYGQHIAAQVYGAIDDTTTFNASTTYEANGRYCRYEIRLDRKGQTVNWFDFLPGSSDLVLMHLNDGVYVVEIDDRSWQNVQLLYPGNNLMLLVDGSTIYIRDGSDYFEIFTELLS